MTQTLEFSATAGMTLTATRCAVGSYTGTDATSVTQQAGTNRYLAVFTAEVSGAYRLDYKSGGTTIGTEVYDLSGAGTFQPRSEAGAPEVRSAVGLAGANLDTQLSTIDDYLDTEVAAIKAKTDNLPADPADASDIAASFATVNSTLSTISGYIDTEVAAIKAKTDLIGTGVVSSVSSPVADDGTISQIVIGDDYLAANSRAISFTVTAPAGLAIADCTAWFGAKLNARNSLQVEGSLTDLGSGNWKMSFDLARADTDDLEPGEYEWSAAVHDASGTEITKARSATTTAEFVRKYTP